MADGNVAAGLRDVTLDDKYDLSKDRVFISGTQAIIRLLMMQRERDRREGLNTAGFVSGYRGSRRSAGSTSTSTGSRSSSPKTTSSPARPQRGAGRDQELGRPAGRDAGRGQV